MNYSALIVSLPELVKDLKGIYSRPVIVKKLREHGVNPINRPDKGIQGKKMFLRCDAEKALFGKEVSR